MTLCLMNGLGWQGQLSKGHKPFLMSPLSKVELTKALTGEGGKQAEGVDFQLNRPKQTKLLALLWLDRAETGWSNAWRGWLDGLRKALDR